MDINQRKVVIVTSLGKRYSGMIDIPNATFRTTDLLNSANIFWKNQNEKCYDNAILMYDVNLYIDESTVYKKFDKIQIKLSEIFYFYDDYQQLGSEMEKIRATTMIKQAQENAQMVYIITKLASNSFYNITGLFYGLFRKKSNDKFLPLTQASIIEIYKNQEMWAEKEIKLPHNFIAVSNQHIESVTMG